MKKPFFSIIIPTYNRGYIVSEAVNSVLKQTFEDFEIIVVDDGSTDNTQELISTIRDNRIRYYRYENNKGVCHARNAAINVANGEWIGFLDSDCTFDKEYLKLRKQYIDKGTTCNFIFGKMLRKERNETIEWPIIDEKSRSKEEIIEGMLLKNIIDTNTAMIKNTLLQGNLFDEKLKRCEDWDLFFRLLILPETNIYFADDLLVNYQLQPNSLTYKDEFFEDSFLLAFEKRINYILEKRRVDILKEFILSTFYWNNPNVKKIVSQVKDMLSSDDYLEILWGLKEKYILKDKILLCLQDLIKLEQRGSDIVKYFQKYNKRISIYGYGRVGKSLLHILKENEIPVYSIIDRKLIRNIDIPFYNDCEHLGENDLIILTMMTEASSVYKKVKSKNNQVIHVNKLIKDIIGEIQGERV